MLYPSFFVSFFVDFSNFLEDVFFLKGLFQLNKMLNLNVLDFQKVEFYIQIRKAKKWMKFKKRFFFFFSVPKFKVCLKIKIQTRKEKDFFLRFFSVQLFFAKKKKVCFFGSRN